MADEKQNEQPKQTEKPKTDDNRPTGLVDPGVTDTAETSVAREVGLTEGDIKALRDDAGLNHLAGNEANTLTWAASPAGAAFREGEKDRVQAAKDEEKAYAKQADDNGLTKSEVKYKEAVEKAAKG